MDTDNQNASTAEESTSGSYSTACTSLSGRKYRFKRHCLSTPSPGSVASSTHDYSSGSSSWTEKPGTPYTEPHPLPTPGTVSQQLHLGPSVSLLSSNKTLNTNGHFKVRSEIICTAAASKSTANGTAQERFRPRCIFPSTTTSSALISDHNEPQTIERDSNMTSSDVISSSSCARLENDTLENISELYLSVVWNGGRLGVAYYDVDSAQIYMMPDAAENDDFVILKAVCSQVKPNYIIVSARQDERLQHAVIDLGADDRMKQLCKNYIQMLPSLEFSLDVCRRRVIQMSLPGIRDHYTDSERSLYMSSLVPFENTSMVCAVGGLLKFLEKNRIGVQLEDDDVRIPVLAVQVFAVDDLMLVDDNSYTALQIFQSDFHPSVYKSGAYSSTKEGLSLFGILNRCKSQAGSKMMRTWFVRPLRHLETLQHRQEAVAFFANPRNVEVTTSLQGCIKQIKNVSRILKKMAQAHASCGDWQSLYKTIYNIIYIGDICRAQSLNIAIFKQVRKSFSDELPKIANVITKVVDFEESIVQGRFVVKPYVDAELDKKKKTYSGLPDLMTKVAKEELSKLSEDIPECNVIYLPQLGYLLAIPMTSKLMETKKYDLPGLELIYTSNQVLHYKSASTKELDRLLGDTQCDIHDMETSIMHKLQNHILEHTQLLIGVMKMISELDCLVAFGVSAKEFNYVRPKLTNDCIIDIHGGRHPLQELCCRPFVPNDIFLGGTHGRMIVLTGANASGKSVYLKQVALMVFMAQIGSFLPAEAAIIGLVDQIFTRIHTMESISVGLSTFMIDLNQVSLAIRNGTERSLVILDEFGKGTETIDGISLLCACLRHWLARPNHCPYVLVSTHFHSMIHQQLLPESSLLKNMTMEVLHDGKELVFLYQLIEGITDSSYACHVAAAAGLPDKLLKRSIQISDLIRLNQPVNRINCATTESQFKRCKSLVAVFLELNLQNNAEVKDYMKTYIAPFGEGNRK